MLPVITFPIPHPPPHTQDWLASSARKVGLAGRPMEWLTPLGLPVVQPYHKPSSKVVSTPTCIIISTLSVQHWNTMVCNVVH